MTAIAFLDLPPRRRPDGTEQPRQSVTADDRPIGTVVEVEPMRWWWQAPGMRWPAPAHGPSIRDCVATLLLIASQQPEPRRGIPARLTITHPVEDAQEEPTP